MKPAGAASPAPSEIGTVKPAENGVGVYDSASTETQYSGSGWRRMISSNDIGGSSQYLNGAGGVEFTFVGDAVAWVSRLSPSSGINDVYIDGSRVGSVDRYSSTNIFAKRVFTRSGLGGGTHTISVKWTGKKNANSTGTNLLVDAFEVVDTEATRAPTGVFGQPYKSGIKLSWPRVIADDLAGYRVYRALNTGGDYTLIGSTDAVTTRLHDVGLTPSSWWRYKVTAIDRAGNESNPSPVETLIADEDRSKSSMRYDNCPTATASVGTADGLRAALKAAGPGTVIRLAGGVYSGQFVMNKSGTSADPIWICGPRTAIIDGGQINDLHGMFLDSVSDVVVTGFTIRNALKGVTVKTGNRVTISDLLVENIGYEGIHLKQFTDSSDVIGNTIRRTGLVEAKYGEGIYIGSSEVNWCALTNCSADTTTRSRLIDNIISATGAQSIEAKEGTSDGLIHGNRVNDSTGASRETSLIIVKGNGWVTSGNSATEGLASGYMTNASVPGWGMDNVFVGNTADLGSTGFGYWMHQPSDRGPVGSLVGCDNVSRAASAGSMNVVCQP